MELLSFEFYCSNKIGQNYYGCGLNLSQNSVEDQIKTTALAKLALAEFYMKL